MMEKENLMQNLLASCLDKDNEQRKKAEKKLKELRQKYPKEFVIEAANELICEDRPQYTRELAGLMFRSIVKPSKGGEKQSPWESLDPEQRVEVREGIMKALATQNSNVRAGASSAIAAIACKELENSEDGWKDLVPTLVYALEHDNPSYKLSSIQTVAKICEDVRPSLINDKDAKNLLTSLMDMVLIDDLKLRCQLLEALLVMIPFAGHKLSRNEVFSMNLTNLIFDFIETGDQHIQILERAWKCMTELAHHFYLSFYDKVGKVLEAAFSLTSITPESSNREMELFERCAMLGMETVSILIKEEHERLKRKKAGFNIIQDVAEPLTEELLKALKLFNKVAFNVDSLCEQIFESIFPATEMALEHLVKLVTENNTEKGKQVLDIIRQTFVESLDVLETKAAGICMVACCFAAKDNLQTRDILVKGFDGFLGFLSSNNVFVIERMLKLFENAFEKHFTILLLDPDYSKPLIRECKRCKDAPYDTGMYLLRIIMKFAETAVKMRVSIPEVSHEIVDIMYDLMVKPDVNAKEIDQQTMACQALTKTLTSMQTSTSERKQLKIEIIPSLCDSLFSSMEHLETLSKQQRDIQDWLMESIAEALLVVQKVTEEQFSKLFDLIVMVFNFREEVTGQGLLLFNSLLHGSVFEHNEETSINDELVVNSVGTMAPFIEHAMRNNYGSKVAMDAMICASTVAMRLRYESHKFYQTLMTPLDEVIAEMNPRDHNHMYVALSAYSDFALYTQALFKPFADNYLKTLNFVGIQIIDYWREKSSDEEEFMDFYEFDEDDRMCLNLTEALIDAYHNTVMAAEQGKWRSKLSSIAVDILMFYLQAVKKMGNIMQPGTKADIGLAFADFLRSLKDVVFQWFSQNYEFIKSFYKHLIELHHSLVEDAKQGRGPRDQDLFEQLQTSFQVMAEWFSKMNLPL